MAEKTERELLKERADLMGLSYANNITTDKLKELVNGEIEPKKEQKAVKATGKELSKEDLDRIQVANLQKRMSKRRRIILSCNDPQMKEWQSTPYLSISNSVVSLPTITVPFNVEWHVPQAYYDLLKEQTCGIPVKSKDAKGRTITIRKTIKRYNVQDLPDLTLEELDELKQAQAMRDGVAKAE